MRERALLGLSLGMTAFLTVAAAGPARAQVVLDNFTRPDASTLGPNWTQVSGSIGISGDRAENVGGAFNGSLATFNGQTSSTVITQVRPGPAPAYTATVLGFADDSHNLFVKVQDNSAIGLFDTYDLYFGDNGNNNAAWANSKSALLTTPFASGTMTVSLSGSTVTLKLTNLLDATNASLPDQTYTATNVPVALLGNGIGIGELGAASIGSFAVPSVPEPATLAILSVASTILAMRRRTAARQAATRIA